MSRGSRGPDALERSDRAPEGQTVALTPVRPEDLPARQLSLPRGEDRERVEVRGREYTLNGAETRTLATVGAFRVVSPDDLSDRARDRGVWHGTWQRLADQGLITRESITDRHGHRHVVSLTRAGKTLFDAHTTARTGGRRQAFYAGIVKPRELRHDSQVYRVFKAEAERIERDGGRLTRVVLDYELKRDYQTFLNRKDRPQDADVKGDRLVFAEAHDLPIIDGHLELPDLRIEYETPDGRLEHRDVEVVTEHYSRAQLAGKARAGFALYRAGGGQTGGGGSPFDPHYMERLL
jgi:hypothetical protein